MNYKTHTITTITATSFLSFYTVIEPSVGLFLGAALGGLLPDIDEPTSYIGRKNSIKIANKNIGLPSLIKKFFGHRGITHSLLAIAVMFIPYFFARDSLNEFSSEFWFPFLLSFLLGLGFGYVFHIVGDSLTVQGVPLFAPFSNKKYGLKLKFFKTNGKVESFVFYLTGILLFYSIYLHINSFISS